MLASVGVVVSGFGGESAVPSGTLLKDPEEPTLILRLSFLRSVGGPSVDLVEVDVHLPFARDRAGTCRCGNLHDVWPEFLQGATQKVKRRPSPCDYLKFVVYRSSFFMRLGKDETDWSIRNPCRFPRLPAVFAWHGRWLKLPGGGPSDIGSNVSHGNVM